METTLKDALGAAGVDTSALATFWEGPAGPIYTLTVPGTEAIARWRTLRALVPQTGHWPVLLGSSEDLVMHQEILGDADARTSGEIIRQGLQMSPQAWFSQQAEEQDDEGLGFAEYHGDWPDGDHANHGFYTPANCCDKRTSNLYLGLVPASHGWEFPAPLRLGGWNDCPATEVHVCLMRYWHDKYRAEVVAATHDVVEMQVARPPATREEALQLAAEQFFYCADIVAQGTGTLERLAATLLNGTVWYFWWD